MSAAPRTLGEAQAACARRLAAAGIEESRREARLLVGLAAAVEPALVMGYPERAIDAAALARLAALTERRAAREPLSRLRGSREFWSLDFALTPATLDPRADSETLIVAALDRLPDRQAVLRLLDFGTGSGCLLLALLSELPRASGVGVDIAPEAAATARRNAGALGLADRAHFLVGSWDQAIVGPVDVILANPPYIRRDDIAGLDPDVSDYDPRRALDGGLDGLDAYPVLVQAARRLLTPSGRAFFELGSGQGAAVASFVAASGLRVETICRDLAGHERCLVAGR